MEPPHPDIQLVLNSHTDSQKAVVDCVKKLTKQLKEKDRQYKAEVSRLERENALLTTHNKKLTQTIRAKIASQFTHMQKLLQLDAPDETTSLHAIVAALQHYCDQKKLVNASSGLVKINRPLQTLVPVSVTVKQKQLSIDELASYMMDIIRDSLTGGCAEDCSDSSSDGMNSLDWDHGGVSNVS